MRLRSHSLATLTASLFATLLAFPAASQTAPPQTAPGQTAPAQTTTVQQQSPPPGATVLSTGTQLVIVDVMVQDRSGKPVKGLTRENFRLTEDRNEQSIRNFEEHKTEDARAATPQMPPMPAGTFSDYTPVPPNGTLNILLLDSLNTPLSDQAYVRYQLQQYVKKADPSARIAIFGLTTRLLMLQGFTSDPTVLKDIVDHKLIPRTSPFSQGIAAIDYDDALSAYNSFGFEEQAFQAQFRERYTLDAFNSLAHYLSNFPGRKNLIWFSGSFPYGFLGGSSTASGLSVLSGSDEEFRETTNLLTRSQVAVYPVDARGLQTPPMFSASQRSTPTIGGVAGFNNQLANDHITMNIIAENTGGQAYYNTNGLAEAASKAINAGSNYYTIAYTPSNRDWNGDYRNIKVQLTGMVSERTDLKLFYRRGYYADTPARIHPHRTALTVATNHAPDAAAAPAPDNPYARIAMSRGAPAPEDILFKVRVLPASTDTESSLAPGNTPDPAKPITGPFRRYMIDFASLTAGVELKPPAQGATDPRYTGAVEFEAFLYDMDGKLLNAAGSTIKLNLTPADNQIFARQAMAFHLEISAPAKGDTYLRLGVHDLTSNHIGVVEVPVSTVGQLPPAVYPTRSPAPATPSPASPSPATPATAPPATPASTVPAAPR